MNSSVLQMANKKKAKEEVLKEIEPTKNELEVLQDRHYYLIADKKPSMRKGIQMWLSGKYKLIEIADELDLHYETVRAWFNDDNDIKKYVELYQAEEMLLVKQKLQSATATALDRMIALCDSSCDAIAIQAARDILDRTGLKPVQKIQKDVNITTYEDKIKNLMEETGIEVEYEVVE